MNSEKIILHIDSRYRDAGFSTEKFEITLAETLQRIKYAEVITVEIPYTFYIITSSNNTFKFYAKGAVRNITIPVGNYSPQQLAISINDLIVESSGEELIEISYMKENYKFSFKPKYNDLILYNANQGSTIAGLIGLTTTLSHPAPSTDSLTTQNIVNLSGPNYILIRSNVLTRPKIIRPFVNTQQDSVIYKLPITGNPGSILIEKNLYPSKITYGVRQKIKKIDFELVDPTGAQLDLNGQDWSITIVLETA